MKQPWLLSLCCGLTLIALKVNGETSIPVNKCCKTGEVLNKMDFSCIKKEGSTIWVDIEAFNKSNPDKMVKATLEKNSINKFPNCLTGFEAEELVEGMLTLDGDVSLRKYEDGFFHENFCVDRDSESLKLTVLVCDACRENGIPCIQMCCPHGQAIIINPDNYYETPDSENPYASCKESGTGKKYDPTFYDHNGREVLGWRRNEQYLLSAPTTEMFKCDEVFKEHGVWWPLNDEGTTLPNGTGLIIDGKLKGVLDMKKTDEETITVFWKPQEFCIVESENPIDGSLDFNFFLCHEGKTDSCENKLWIVTSVSLIISIVFLLLTLAVYLIEPTVKKQFLFSRITMAFIVNLTLSYITIVHDNLTTDPDILYAEKGGTIGCKLSGYLKMYFFLAFFFWINSMAYNIYQKFSNMFVQKSITGSRRVEYIKFWKYFAYAQGVPLLIIMVTAIVDSQAPKVFQPTNSTEVHWEEETTNQSRPANQSHFNEEDYKYYPNMGVYSCFVGFEPQSEEDKPYYVESPEFIYFQSYMLIILISNIFFMVFTVNSIHGTFKVKAEIRENQEKMKGEGELLRRELKIIVQLFTVTGIWWIFEFIGSYIAWVDGYEKNCIIRYFLDLPNLLAGLLIFVATVCKKTVLKGLQETTGLVIMKDKTGVSEANTTKDTNLTSTRM